MVVETPRGLLVEDGFLATGKRVAIRHAAFSDMAELLRLSAASMDFHDPWISLPHSEEDFVAYLGRFDRVHAVCLLICIVDPELIAGFVTVSGIVGRPYHRGVLGYGAFAPAAGRGYMTEGLPLVFEYCFTELGLHRLEADIQPGNGRSIALAERVGMQREGFSPQFISIKGVWRDHERWAIIDRSPAGRGAASGAR